MDKVPFNLVFNLVHIYADILELFIRKSQLTLSHIKGDNSVVFGLSNIIYYTDLKCKQSLVAQFVSSFPIIFSFDINIILTFI